MNELPTSWVEIARAPDRKKCHELSLVLRSVGLAHATAEHLGAWVLLVPEPSVEQARDQLARYERENRGWPPREAPVESNSGGMVLALGYVALLVFVFYAQDHRSFGVDWHEVGLARAARVRGGEPWLALTALTLHGDFVHLAGNLFFGAVFGVLLCWSLGAGLTALCFVLSGALGNFVNACIQDGSHASLGASTAVFGVLGAQAAFEFMRRGSGRSAWRRRMPLVAGVVLLGLLGMGGAGSRAQDLEPVLHKTDVIAHLTGFAAGLGLGAFLGRKRSPPRLPLWAELALGGAALALVVGSWALALRHG